MVLVQTSVRSILIPQKEPTAKRERVVPCTATRRHLVHFVDVATTDDNIVDFKRRDESVDHFANHVSPYRDAEPLQPVEAEVSFVGSAPV
jgi:hypothetical protein